MFKNKINFLLAVLQVFVFVQNCNAMDGAADNDASLLLSLPMDVKTIIWNNVTSDMPSFLEDAGRMVARLSLVNKEMNKYFSDDNTLHNFTIAFDEQKRKKQNVSLHLGEIRAHLQCSQLKRLQYALYEVSFPLGGYYRNAKVCLKNVFAAGFDVNHRFVLDPRYYPIQTHNLLTFNLQGATALASICATPERLENDDIRKDVMEVLLAIPQINATIADDAGKTPLMWSLYNWNGSFNKAFDVLWRKAIEKGLDVGVNLQDNDGNTAFMQIVKTSEKFSNNILPEYQRVRLQKLLRIGANPYIPDNKGVAAMDILQKFDPGFAGAIEILYQTQLRLEKDTPYFVCYKK